MFTVLVLFVLSREESRPSVAIVPELAETPSVYKEATGPLPESAFIEPSFSNETARISSSAAVLLSEIPPGIFHDQLVQLSVKARETALQTLGRIHYKPDDADSLRVDSFGGVFFVCTFHQAGDSSDRDIDTALAVEGAEAVTIAGAAMPISSPPVLHSRPGAGKTLFLDFNGHDISGTRWNSNTNFGGPMAVWNCRPYDTDNDETTFSASELAVITQVWERVSEDYAPFDVDITTEQPTWSRNAAHALITPTIDSKGDPCPHDGYGGIAYVDPFGDYDYSYSPFWESYSPAWVIVGSAANMAEAASHEVGHNLGLSHDGTTSSAYYSGHGNGVTSIKWGPIMGTGYNDDVSQWSKGEYYNSNEPEDDLAIIQGKLSYRPDDHGDDNAHASILSADAGGVVSETGIIETIGDPDVFLFTTGSGIISLSASAFQASSLTRGANLDILLELYNSSGTLVASNNPLADVDASITTSVSAGNYYLHVKPTGVGNPTSSPPTGFTVYGSLGQYWISGVVSGDIDSDGMPNQWEMLYFGSFTNAVATDDLDGDGLDNYSEYVAGTLPDSTGSVFEVTSYQAPSSNGAPFVVNWNTMEGRLYSVSYSDDLLYSGFGVLGDATDLPYTRTSYTDTVERATQQNYYRVEVRLQP